MNKLTIVQNSKEVIVELNGEDIGKAIQGVTLKTNGAKCTAQLDVLVVDLTLHVDEPNIIIYPQAHALLQKLGWTPPPPPRSVDDLALPEGA